MTFNVGQKVECIKRDRWTFFSGEIVPVFKGIYTIRAIDVDPEGTFLRFVEIVNAPAEYDNGYGECSFWIRRFRPVVERKTDISIFTAILTPKKAKVEA